MPAGELYINSRLGPTPWILAALLPLGFLIWMLLEWATRPLMPALSRWLFRMEGRRFAAGRFRGVPVFVHWTVLALLVAALPGLSFLPFFGAVGLIAYGALVVLHEGGHVVVAQAMGCRVHSMEIGAIHGVTIHDAPVLERQAVAIAWAGVVAQVIVGVPVWAWLHGFAGRAAHLVGPALVVLGPVNAAVAIVNLLPIPGLDGAMAWRVFRRRRRAFRVVSGRER
jgi:Zn-dependent protease